MAIRAMRPDGPDETVRPAALQHQGARERRRQRSRCKGSINEEDDGTPENAMVPREGKSGKCF